MGFFDRFSSKKPTTPASNPSSTPAPASDVTSTPAAGSAANIKSQLSAAREKLELKDVAGAVAIYEELLRSAGDRADVLVTLSGDLGSCGYVEQIVELVAPRYDAERHGPATGLNLLQAYLATHNTEAAQHLLDILFALQRPELEERLHGFSNALAELIEAERRGTLSRPPPNGTAEAATGQIVPPQAQMISLVTISKPIWAYGIESVPGILPTKSDKLRRVAFSQLALLNDPELPERMKKPEDEFGRLCRGIPLWLAETFFFAPHYAPIGVVGTVNKEHYALFGTEWTMENIRQMVETSQGLDYVFTGTLRHRSGDYELALKVWEVKKFRERKVFNARWTPATADAELAKLGETVRAFMEWQAHPPGAGLKFVPPAAAQAHCDSLATSTSLFLADKGVLPAAHLEPVSDSLPRLAQRAAASEADSLLYLTALDRAGRLGLLDAAGVDAPLFDSREVEQARAYLNL